MLRSTARFVLGRGNRAFHSLPRRGGVQSRSVAPRAVAGPVCQRVGVPGGSLAWLAARGFAAAVPKSDKDLRRALQGELEHEKSSYKPAEISPPEPWSVEEKSASAAIILRRSFGNEDIAVTFVAEPDNLEDDMADQHEHHDDEDDDDMKMDDMASRVPFTVSVSKDGDSAPLEFLCVTHGGQDVTIENVNFGTSDNSEGFAYEGPVFSSLDENLQKRFESYLSTRGVNEDLAAYIVESLQDKEQREYMAWLSKVESFIKK